MPDRNPPEVSVIVPHRDDWAGLDRCIASLVAQRSRAPASEIIVVDNGSADRAAEARFIASFGKEIVLLREPRPGAACARNRGVAAARGEILLFIDSDCLARGDWIANLAD
ncbi:MAG TPA: glycosyltransferase family A protein, partial [Woeseiaceae bacterium]